RHRQDPPGTVGPDTMPARGPAATSPAIVHWRPVASRMLRLSAPTFATVASHPALTSEQGLGEAAPDTGDASLPPTTPGELPVVGGAFSVRPPPPPPRTSKTTPPIPAKPIPISRRALTSTALEARGAVIGRRATA